MSLTSAFGHKYPQAFSAFYYNLHFLNLTEEQSLSSVNDTVWKFCSRSWMTVRSWPGAADPCPCLAQPGHHVPRGSVHSLSSAVQKGHWGSWKEHKGLWAGWESSQHPPTCSLLPRSLLLAVLSLQCGCTEHCSVHAAPPCSSSSTVAEGLSHQEQDPPPRLLCSQLLRPHPPAARLQI